MHWYILLIALLAVLGLVALAVTVLAVETADSDAAPVVETMDHRLRAG